MSFHSIPVITVAALAVYALLTNPLLLIAIGFLSGGFVAINKFGELQLQRETRSILTFPLST